MMEKKTEGTIGNEYIIAGCIRGILGLYMMESKMETTM